MATKKQKGLGRGLEALLGTDASALDNLGHSPDGTSAVTVMSPDDLLTGKYQPRTQMDEQAILALSESIRQQGIMQPILVRAVGTAGKNSFEVIAGERRLRAAQRAGLKEVPVIVRDVDDEQAAIMALIENIQREDLNPLEEAKGLRRLLDDFAMTHEQIAATVGRSRSATSNLLRLLNLAQPVQDMLMSGSLEMGHARALLPLNAADQIQAANLIASRAMSVRDAEKLVAKGLHATKRRPQAQSTNPDVVRMQNRLADQLGTVVALKASGKGKGQVTFNFHDWDQFHGLLEKLGLSDLINEN